jgi:ABC-type uncharacterized transport system involved in gliding motility auxiliary subunit
MKNLKALTIIFITGISLLVIGSFSALVMGEFGAFPLVTMLLGALLIGYYVFAGRKEVAAAFTKRETRYGINAFVYTLIVLAIIVVIQAIFTVNSGQIDLTKNKRHTLSDETIKALHSLTTDIDAYYFYSLQARNGQVEDLLKRYEQGSPKFRASSVDADKNPMTAKRFNVDRYGIVVLARKDSGAFEKVDQLAEEGITNGLIRITKGEKKKIYFTKGHGEPQLDAPQNEKTGYSALKQEIQSYNYTAQDIELFSAQGGVPQDCAMLVVAGPQSDLFDPEITAIKQYLRRGGKMLMLYSAFQSLPKLNALMKSCGVIVHNDVVVDKLGRMFGGDVLMPIISSYEYHDITKGFRVATFFPMCRTFDLKGGVTGVQLQGLAKTNQGSWGETDLTAIKKGSASNDPKADYQSPLSVAAVINIDNSVFAADAGSATVNTKAAIVIMGSSDMANNSYLSSSGNKDFILNSINWLAGQGDMISIRPKDNSFEPIFLSKIQGRLVFIIPTIFLPLVVIAVGVLVFARRRMS